MNVHGSMGISKSQKLKFLIFGIFLKFFFIFTIKFKISIILIILIFPIYLFMSSEYSILDIYKI